MQPFNALSYRRTQVLLVVGAAVATAVVTAIYARANLLASGVGTSQVTVLGVELVQWLLWAAAVPVVARVEQRFRVISKGWWRGISAHIATAILLFLIIDAALAPFLANLELGYHGSMLSVFFGRAASKAFEAFG